VSYLGTSFCLTLGAWRLRLQIALEDAPDDDAVVCNPARSQGESWPPHHVRVDSRAAGRRAG
jgi:hypothetical protein